MARVSKLRRPERASLGRPAQGQAIGHHGELVQGAFEDDQGRLHRGLVTLPLDCLRSTASLVLDESGIFSVAPRGKIKALRAVQITLEHLGHPALGGQLCITSDIPIGHGYGSSTADVVASIRAVAAALGTNLPPISISRLAVVAEIAADATAFEDQALLFAQRKGRFSSILVARYRHSSSSASRQTGAVVSTHSR